jgi:hypothetical protein
MKYKKLFIKSKTVKLTAIQRKLIDYAVRHLSVNVDETAMAALGLDEPQIDVVVEAIVKII